MARTSVSAQPAPIAWISRPEHQRRRRLRQRRDHAAEQEQREPRQQHRPPAVAVRQRAVEQRGERHAEQRDAEGELGVGVG